MSKLMCDACGGSISDHALRSAQNDAGGQVVCTHCGAHLTVAARPRRLQRLYLSSIGLLVAGAPLVFADGAIWKAVGAVGVVAFAAAAVHSHRSSRRLAVVLGPARDASPAPTSPSLGAD